MNSVLQSWNQLESDPAAAEILSCCGSRAWAMQLARARPVSDETAVFELSDAVWSGLGRADWEEAFASHPRIGEQAVPLAATTRSADWSRHEQSGVAESSTEIQQRLRIGNAKYEERFGRTYIVCASGKSAEQMLGMLESRLINDADRELREAAEQQRQITQLRLRKWLQV